MANEKNHGASYGPRNTGGVSFFFFSAKLQDQITEELHT